MHVFVIALQMIDICLSTVHIDIETMDGTRVSQFHYGSRLTWSDYAPLGGGYYFPLSEINSKLEIGQEYRVVLRLYARASALKQNFGQIPKPEFNDILYRSILPENVNWLRLVSLQLTDGQLKVHEKILRDASPVIGHQFDEFPEDEMIDMRDFTISVGQMLIQILYYGKLKEEYPRHYLAEQLRSVYILASRYDMHRVMVTALNEFTNIHPDKQSAIKMMTTLGEHRSEIGDKYLDCVMDVKWNFGACPLKLGDKSPGHVSSGKDHFSWLFRKIRN